MNEVNTRRNLSMTRLRLVIYDSSRVLPRGLSAFSKFSAPTIALLAF